MIKVEVTWLKVIYSSYALVFCLFGIYFSIEFEIFWFGYSHREDAGEVWGRVYGCSDYSIGATNYNIRH
jgi:hypothetical protein